MSISDKAVSDRAIWLNEHDYLPLADLCRRVGVSVPVAIHEMENRLGPIHNDILIKKLYPWRDVQAIPLCDTETRFLEEVRSGTNEMF